MWRNIIENAKLETVSPDGATIKVNLAMTDVLGDGTLFHEFWHYFQSQYYDNGEDPSTCKPKVEHIEVPFSCAYGQVGRKDGYTGNPFEREAEVLGKALPILFTDPLEVDGSRRFAPNWPATFEQDVLLFLWDSLPQLEAIWKDEPVQPTHLKELRRRLERQLAARGLDGDLARHSAELNRRLEAERARRGQRRLRSILRDLSYEPPFALGRPTLALARQALSAVWTAIAGGAPSGATVEGTRGNLTAPYGGAVHILRNATKDSPAR